MTHHWTDPHLTADMAAKLLAQPYHHLLTHGSSHLLAKIIPGQPADILTLYTPPEARRQGHARALLTNLITRVKAAQGTSITLDVRASNAAAISLYERLGFTRQTTRKGYYTNPPDDAVVYMLNLG